MKIDAKIPMIRWQREGRFQDGRKNNLSRLRGSDERPAFDTRTNMSGRFGHRQGHAKGCPIFQDVSQEKIL